MAELVNHLAGMTCDKYQDALNENNIYEMIKDMRGLESLRCWFESLVCLHQLREKSTGLLSAPHRRQPRTDARRPGIGRNCAQIMPRTALGHAEQREVGLVESKSCKVCLQKSAAFFSCSIPSYLLCGVNHSLQL